MRYAPFSKIASQAGVLVGITIMAGMLAGCQTDGTASNPIAELAAYNAKGDDAKVAAKPPEPPMTRSKAASDCWMSTEKGGASANLDKRADLVNICIENKMKGGDAPKS
jgi:hypothetical protein